MNNRVEKLVYDLVSDSIYASVLDSDYNSLSYRIQGSISDSVKRIYE
jgi:hypothetical protein